MSKFCELEYNLAGGAAEAALINYKIVGDELIVSSEIGTQY